MNNHTIIAFFAGVALTVICLAILLFTEMLKNDDDFHDDDLGI